MADGQARSPDTHIMGVYNRAPLAFERGEGVRLWSTEGDAYLDCVAGIAVDALERQRRAVVDAHDVGFGAAGLAVCHGRPPKSGNVPGRGHGDWKAEAFRRRGAACQPELSFSAGNRSGTRPSRSRP
jgi:hypothetical protein